MSSCMTQMHATHFYVPEGSDVAPSVSMVMFSELSAVPMDASDSGVSSSDARGSRISISYVSSSLQTAKRKWEVFFSNISLFQGEAGGQLKLVQKHKNVLRRNM